MLKYTILILTKSLIVLFIFIFNVNFTKVNAKNIVANYNITWNKLLLGNLVWEFNLDNEKYEFNIELEASGFASKFYPFYGLHSSKGGINKNIFIPKSYLQIWKTKKKNRVIEILYDNKKIKSIKIKPEENHVPKIDFLKLKNPTDPVAAALSLIIFKNNLIKNVFDGRRVYDLSTKQNNSLNYPAGDFFDLIAYELNIQNYNNIWKDHNKTDLKSVKIITGKKDFGFDLPLFFKIYNKGLVFKIDYISHRVLN